MNFKKEFASWSGCVFLDVAFVRGLYFISQRFLTPG